MAREEQSAVQTLKACAVARLLSEMIISIKVLSSQDYIVMVVDSSSVQILSSVLSMFSVTQQGIMIIEKLELDRKLMPDTDALYFLTPTNAVIARMIKDFAVGKRQYRFAHVVWTGDLADRQMEYVANSDMIPYIKTFKIAHMEFLISDPNVFHFDMPNALNELYVEKQTETLEIIATRLSQVCGVLHELPFICFSNSSAISNRLAFATQQRVDQLFGSVPSLTITNPRGTLVILDRSYDITTPLMHDIHFETLVFDLLKVSEDNSIAYMSVDGNGESLRKTAVLDDRDQLWMDMKYKEIDEAVDALGETFQQFADGHSEIRAVQAQHARISNTQKMAQIVKALPQYQEMLAKYSLHMNLADACMDAFLNTDVRPCTELEQKIITGLDSDGGEVKLGPLTEALVKTINALTSDDLRMRLVLLYCACYEVSEKDRRRLFDALKQPEIQAVQNLKHFGLDIQGEGSRTVARAAQRSLRETKARIKASQKPFNYSVPKLDDILKRVISGDFSEFQFTKQGPAEEPEVEVRGNLPRSLRKPKAAASFVNSGRGEGKGRLIVFVIGGLSYSECRVAQTVATATNAKVVIGGTSLVRPNEFSEQIMSMHGRGLQAAGIGLGEVKIDLT